MQTAPAPLEIVRGEGAWLYTSDGRKILDGISSWWVNIHGHAHPVLSEALAAQARQLEHVIFANCTHEPGVALAEQLVLAANGLELATVALRPHLIWGPGDPHLFPRVLAALRVEDVGGEPADAFEIEVDTLRDPAAIVDLLAGIAARTNRLDGTFSGVQGWTSTMPSATHQADNWLRP